ncbi:hypothetical protein THEMA_05350 [Thermotoga maritima MSB8]|nr:hypothetical protein THEMA_05350 [Thermotoga maritima MSB8]
MYPLPLFLKHFHLFQPSPFRISYQFVVSSGKGSNLVEGSAQKSEKYHHRDIFVSFPENSCQ